MHKPLLRRPDLRYTTGMQISPETVRTALDYNPETGVFRWRWREGSGRAVNVFNSRFPGQIAGKIQGFGYRQIKLENRHFMAHRLAWLHVYGRHPVGDIDHINGLRDDNRIANLREATRMQNCANSFGRTTNTTGFKGVSWRKRDQCFCAGIRVNGKRLHLGHYTRAEDAYAAYCEASRTLHGEFSKTDPTKEIGQHTACRARRRRRTAIVDTLADTFNS